MTLQKTVLFSKLTNYSAVHYESQIFYQCLDEQIAATQMFCSPLTYFDNLTFACIGCVLE